MRSRRTCCCAHSCALPAPFNPYPCFSCQAPRACSNRQNPCQYRRFRSKKVCVVTPCHSLSLNHGAIYARKAHALSQLNHLGSVWLIPYHSPSRQATTSLITRLTPIRSGSYLENMGRVQALSACQSIRIGRSRARYRLEVEG